MQIADYERRLREVVDELVAKLARQPGRRRALAARARSRIAKIEKDARLRFDRARTPRGRPGFAGGIVSPVPGQRLDAKLQQAVAAARKRVEDALG